MLARIDVAAVVTGGVGVVVLIELFEVLVGLVELFCSDDSLAEERVTLEGGMNKYSIQTRI